MAGVLLLEADELLEDGGRLAVAALGRRHELVHLLVDGTKRVHVRVRIELLRVDALLETAELLEDGEALLGHLLLEASEVERERHLVGFLKELLLGQGTYC